MPGILLSPDAMWYWFIAALIAATVEIFLRLIPVGFGLTCVLFGILSNFPAIYARLSLDVFLAVAAILLFGGNYLIKKKLSDGQAKPVVSDLRRNRAAKLVGMTGVVSEVIRNGSGRVRVDGTLWRCLGPDAEAGQRVIVTAVDQNTLAVKPME